MDSTVLSGIIGAVGTVIGALLGALLARSEFLDNIFRSDKIIGIAGKWESRWKDTDDTNESAWSKETVFVEKQKGSRIWGYIEMDAEPDKRWEFEGNFNGRFLQLMYYPSKKADNKLFLDYGCYFFDLQGDGKFSGYSIGFSWDTNNTHASFHEMKRVR
jgi:hypothetical protein